MPTTISTHEDERGSFVFYLIGTAILTLPVTHMFYKMWTQGAYLFFDSLISFPFVPETASGLQPLVMLGSGLYLSWLVLFANDWRKRYQGYILMLGTIVTVVTLAALGVGIPNLDLTRPVNVGSFIIGLFIGVATESRPGADKLGGDLTAIDYRNRENTWAHWVTTERGRKNPAEFPIAYRGLVLFIIVVVMGGNVLNFIFNQNTVQVALHFITSLGLLYFLYSFLDINIMMIEAGSSPDSTINFEQKVDQPNVQFEVLGPQQSGKTYLALGFLLTLTRDDKYTIQSLLGRMPEIIEEHSNRVIGVTDGLIDWGIGNTLIDTAERVGIEFTKTDTDRGKVLDGTINMFDYPGEVLEDLSEELDQQRGQKMTDGGEQPPDSSTDQEDEDLGTLGDVVDQAQDADTEDTEKFGPDKVATQTESAEDKLESTSGGELAEREIVTRALIKNVGSAEKLIILIDSQRFVTEDGIIKNDPGMMLTEMTKISQSAGPDEVIPVATKADYLMEEYDDLDAGTLPTDEEYSEFRQHAEEMLDNGHPMVSTLIELADHPVFPVYYLTGTNEDEETKLKVEDGRIHPIGYEPLLNAIVGE
ncbi:hypothetical protein [Haloarcula amylovorans]|uniref:hypothetical protein n=1 Tax=Haloarcula amylovorans TaxID=2562280 RepID=UPI001076581E|nr:hypothetical protein [Halomicroarcula amylolytica]